MPYDVLDPATAAAAPATAAGAPLVSVGETLASFETELGDELFGRTDTPANAARKARWINWAYRNLAQSLDIVELWASVGFSFVADQNLYLVPVGLSWIKRLMIQDTTTYPFDDGRELEMIDQMTYRNLPDTDALIPDGSANSWIVPQSYFRFARMLVIWPTPQLAYTAPCDFRVRPTDLVNPTDSPILPVEFHEPLFHLARVRAFRALKQYKESALAQNDFLVTLRPLLNSDAEERDAMHMVMQPIRTASQLYRAARGSSDAVD